jgi:hypothetical protein
MYKNRGRILTCQRVLDETKAVQSPTDAHASPGRTRN